MHTQFDGVISNLPLSRTNCVTFRFDVFCYRIPVSQFQFEQNNFAITSKLANHSDQCQSAAVTPSVILCFSFLSRDI